MDRVEASPTSPALVLASGILAPLVIATFAMFLLESTELSVAMGIGDLRSPLVSFTGGETLTRAGNPLETEVHASFVGLLGVAVVFQLGTIILSSWIRRRHEGGIFTTALTRQAILFAGGTLPLLGWTVAWILNLLVPTESLTVALYSTPSLAFSASLAIWLWMILAALTGPIEILPRESSPSKRRGTSPVLNETASAKRISTPFLVVLGGIASYVIIFVSMNLGLWFNLQIPHGDSAMYEEHLWNVLHGRGFRSDLDQGLFLGEHIQVVHLLLLPVYFFWRSHLLLELAETLALALTAIPAYSIALRHSGDRRAAAMVALASLCYFPLHYLDIAIDLKTFRPIAFGIPAMLWAIDSMERRRWGWMLIGLLLALSSKEDYAIVIAPLGVWLAVESWRRGQGKVSFGWGAALAVLATVYLGFVMKVAIPYFRNWETVHYASYFQAFGSTPGEIIWTMLTRPDRLIMELVTLRSLLYLALLLVPLGVPWRSWSQLLVGLPLFITLCLNELAQSTPGPYHHFHAPLIPILLWASAASLGTGNRRRDAEQDQATNSPSNVRASRSRAAWTLCFAFSTAIFFSHWPISMSFWSEGSSFYWQKLYVADERVEDFQNVLEIIPQSARVASTDLVHPRFTHHDRSYDYSDYRRAVANYEDRVPDDTDFIVIDKFGRYNRITEPGETREMQREPDKWSVIEYGTPETRKSFIILKRVTELAGGDEPSQTP